MLSGVGTDILLVERMRRCLDSRSFMRRTFTQAELDNGSGRADPTMYYAKVFAGKEAVFKCFGVSGDQLGSWLNIEIRDSEEAQPSVVLAGAMAHLAEARKVREVLLSLSSDTEYVVAFAAVVEEGRDGE
jgi:holo-[acyl-carrier protein] synthase